MTEQPISTDIYMADGVFAKTMVIQKADTLVPQHSHTFPHMSVLVRGSVRVWKDGCEIGDYVAPDGIFIPAKSKHTFRSLEDNTIILCVHDIGTAESVSIHEEHQLAGVE